MAWTSLKGRTVPSLEDAPGDCEREWPACADSKLAEGARGA